MDQIKAALPLIKQHSFWVMAAGILVACVVSWWVSTARLRDERDKQVSDIKQKVQTVSSIQGQNPKHPNDSTNKGMDDITRQYAYDVQLGWEAQYKQQESI